MSSQNADSNMKHRHAQIAIHRREQLPQAPLDTGSRGILPGDGSQNDDFSLMFGPGGAIFLPENPPNNVQPSQPQPQPQPSLQTASALSPVGSQSQSSASTASASPQASTSEAPPPSSTASPPSTAPARSMPTPSSTTPPTSSATSSSSQPQSQSQSQNQSQSQPSSAGVSYPETSAFLVSRTQAPTGLLSSLPSFPATQASSSTSATSTPSVDSESLPHLAGIVIGVIVGVSLIAFLATLGSWLYKQRYHKHEHTEITSITSSSFDDKPPGFFGCLKRRGARHTDDMSELGFGLGRVDFFGQPNSGDDDHRAGLALGPENVVREGEHGAPAFRNPFVDPVGSGFTASPYPTVRPLPAHLQTPGTEERAGSLTLEPYQHLAPARALGGTSATPLTVANLVPGDVSGDEGGQVRHDSLGTPRPGASAPRFMGLVEGDGLAVPWAPLSVRREPPRDDAVDAGERDVGFEPLALSRTSTLSLALSRTFSRRLGYSLSKAAEWRDGATRPPAGTFRATWDAQGDSPGESETWAATLRNNFYSALSAVGGSMQRRGSGSAEAALPGPGGSLPNPHAVAAASSRRSSMRLPFTGQARKDDDVEDILTPRPARVAAMRVGRSKGSLIRGRLGIAGAEADGAQKGTGLGLGLEALSRSSTLSTSWSDAEKEPAWTRGGTGPVRVREAPRLPRVRTGSTAPRGTSHPAGGRGKNLKSSRGRPRYSRMRVSDSSVWSSESDVSGAGR